MQDYVGNKEYMYSAHHMCLQCGESVPELEPRSFSFNSPIGACKKCHGLGMIHEWPWADNDPKMHGKKEYPDFFGPKYATEHTCRECYGKRLNKYALAVTIGDENIFDVCAIIN